MDNKNYDWLHIPTMRLSFSVREDKLPHPVGEYLKNPDLLAVKGVERYYWKVENNSLMAMSPTERAAIDVQRTTEALDEKVEEYLTGREVTKAFALLLIDEINILREAASMQPRTMQQFVQAMKQRINE